MNKSIMKKTSLNLIKYVHQNFFFPRRIKVLGNLIARHLPERGQILDVGCGNGLIDKEIMQIKPRLNFTGIDVLKQKDAVIPVKLFDGKTIPFPDNYFDCVLLIDTVHHVSSRLTLLKEIRRVTKKNIIIKDHFAQTRMDRVILRITDWVGNRPYKVSLPYHYWSSRQWESVWRKLGMKTEEIVTDVKIYPFPLSTLADRSFNFVVKLSKMSS